jgi:ribonucleoside-diphosphate reductase alpha chain
VATARSQSTSTTAGGAAGAVSAAAGTLTPNARTVLEHRYLQKNQEGRVTETPEDMFHRVAGAVAEADRQYDGSAEAARWEAAYFGAMSELFFLPNSPALMNAGTPVGQLAACFVLPVGDSIAEIFGAVRDMALIHQSGGGTGFSFSRLRPQRDKVSETGGVASGPVSFMRVFDMATEVVKQGGRRRGANMGILNASHPDIMEFITAKDDRTLLTNFNLSVAASDAFMRAVQEGSTWDLVNPRNGRRTAQLPARKIWLAICEAAWRNGDPGLLFVDEVNRHNPTPTIGQIEATNPCGEQPLLPYEACILGSINLSKIATPHGIDWHRLEELTALGVRFLDGAIDVSRYPLPHIGQMSRANRKIGVGVMGFAEALIKLGIPYASEEAVGLGGRLMATITQAARRASVALAERRGPFPNCARSIWPSRGVPSIRNATVTTVAPTGTLSIIAGTSSGIEPLFAVAYVRSVLDGRDLSEESPLFLQALAQRKIPPKEIIAQVVQTGSVQGVTSVPADIRRVFQTALDIPGEWHVRMQAAIQRHTDNAVSKTVNLPATATVDDVAVIYRRAWELRCKGVTAFRYGSRGEQVLHLGKIPGFTREPSQARAHGEYAGECRLCSV